MRIVEPISALILVALAIAYPRSFDDRAVPAIAFAVSGGVAAQSPTPADAERMLPEMRAGFDGLAKAGRWLPVRVTVANDGPSFEGDVRLVTATPGGGPSVAYGRAVDLPTRSRKLVQLLGPAPSSARDLRVELTANGREIAARQVSVRLLGASDFLVGMLTDDDVPPAGLSSLRRGGGPVSLARLAPADLPADPIALQALDALVIRNATTGRLDQEQRAALRTWIEGGGQLVVAGGPSWRRTVEGVEDLLPVEGLWTREVKHLRAIGRYAAGPPPDETVLLTGGSPVAGARVFVEQDGSPIIAEHWRGRGRVTFLAADPALEPFPSWPGAEALWQRTLVGGRPPLLSLDEPMGGMTELQLRTALAQVMDLGLPGPGWLAVFLLAYVACVGPLQYALLRRLDRREWAWLSFPALALGFAAVAYVGGGRLRGADVRLGAISIVRSADGTQTATADTYVGLVAPARRAYDLAFVDGAPPRAVTTAGGLAPTGDLASGGPLVLLGRPALLPGLRLEGRTLQAFHTRGFVPTPTPVQADLRAVSGRLEGLVTNVGPDRLEDAIILASGESLLLGDLGPGESRPVSLALPTSRLPGAAGPWPFSTGAAPGGAPVSSSGGAFDERSSLLTALLGPGRGGEAEAPGGVFLLAWSGATPPRIWADGLPIAGSAARLVQQMLPVRYGAEAVVIPPGLLPRTVLDGAALSRGPGLTFLVRGPIVFQYDLPPDVAFAQVDRLTVHVALDSRPGPSGPTAPAAPPVVPLPASSAVRVSLLRWTDRAWVDVPLGGVVAADMTFGGGFVDGGAIRLRLEPNSPETFIRQLDVSLEGPRG